MVEKADVAAWLDRAGFRVVSLTLVSSDPTEPVYRVVTKEQKYFAKIIDGNTGDTMRTVLEDELSVGMPQSTLIQEDRYLLIMESADGRPLSWLIPICLLPGLWRYFSRSLGPSTEQIGAALQNLHAGTFDGIRPVDTPGCRMANRLNVGSDVQDKLKKDTVRQLESLFEEVRDERLPHVQVHGDPTPHNIFWDIRSGEVNLIDFNLHPSVAAEDLVVFEAGIELMTARLPFGRPSQSEAIVDRFRLSYTTGGVHETVPERTVKILKLAYYVHLLNKYFRHMTPNTSRERVTQHIDRRILKRKIRNLVSLL